RVSSCGATIRIGRETPCGISAPSPRALRRRPLRTGRGGSGGGLELVFDLAEDLLDDVLHRQDADRLSVAIDDRRHVQAVPPHLLQDNVDALVLGDAQELLDAARVLRTPLVLVGGVQLAVERQRCPRADAYQAPA